MITLAIPVPAMTLVQHKHFAIYRYLGLSICAALLIAVGGWRYGGTGDRRWLILFGLAIACC